MADNPEFKNFDLLFADDFIEVRGNLDQLAKARRVLLSFSGVGQKIDLLEVQTPEFVGSALRRGAPIFIFDVTRSWGNRLDFERLAAVLQPHLEGREVVSIGNSMGGFLAILATSFFPITTTIAIAPQFSVDPKIVPEEKRWLRHRDAIHTWRYESLAPHFNKRTRYFAIFGGSPRETIQSSRFPIKPNVRSFIVPGAGHDVGKRLKAAGVLDSLIDGCLRNDFSIAAITPQLIEANASSDGKRGHLPPYERLNPPEFRKRSAVDSLAHTVSWFRRRLRELWPNSGYGRDQAAR